MASKILGIASVVLMIFALYMALIFAPNEAQQGTPYRIIYFHVPMGILSYVSAYLLGFAGILFLIKRDLKYDRFAVATAELGVLCSACSLITGSIWAKPIWGVWWAWDPRLILQLLLGLFFVAYFMLRAYLPDRERRAKLASVFGVLGMIDVPFNYYSIEWWKTQHPQPVFRGEGSIDPDMRLAAYAAALALTVLYGYLLSRRMAIAKIEEEVDYLEHVVYAHD
jgi:heme exporter protein C